MVSYQSDSFNLFIAAQEDMRSSMHLLRDSEKIEKKDCVNNDLEVFYECSPGIRHGLYRRYNIFGTNIYACTYYYGRREGIAVEYYPNGKIMVKCNFKNGKLDGPVSMYDMSGSIIKTLNYINGLCIN